MPKATRNQRRANENSKEKPLCTSISGQLERQIQLHVGGDVGKWASQTQVWLAGVTDRENFSGEDQTNLGVKSYIPCDSPTPWEGTCEDVPGTTEGSQELGVIQVPTKRGLGKKNIAHT